MYKRKDDRKLQECLDSVEGVKNPNEIIKKKIERIQKKCKVTKYLCEA